MPPGSWGLSWRRIQRTRQSDQRSRCLWVQMPDSNWGRSAAGVPLRPGLHLSAQESVGGREGADLSGTLLPLVTGTPGGFPHSPAQDLTPNSPAPRPGANLLLGAQGRTCWGPRTHSRPVPWAPWPGRKGARTSGSPGGASALSIAGARPPSTHLGAGPPSAPAAPAAGRHPPTPGWGPAPRAPPWVPPPGAAAIRPRTSSGPSQATASVAPGRRPSCSRSCWALRPRAARGPQPRPPGGRSAWGRGRGAGRGRESLRLGRPLGIPFRRDPRFPDATRVSAGRRAGGYGPRGAGLGPPAPRRFLALRYGRAGLRPGLRSVGQGPGRRAREGLGPAAADARTQSRTRKAW